MSSPPTIAGLRFVGVLGSGGSADVYAYDAEFPARRVAVKVPRLTGHPIVQRLVAEANAQAALNHPHIVPILAAGITDGGRPFLVMPYYAGASLAERAAAGPWAVADVLRVGVQVGGALATAHAAGLVHRDVKPANVLTTDQGVPALADFGLAGVADEDDPGLSLPWSAPEVLDGDPATERSDVFSLAATLWTLLAGHASVVVPGGDNDPATMLRRARRRAPVLTRPDLPPHLGRALDRAMALDPADRTPTALAFVAELQAIQRGMGLPVTEAVVPIEGAPSAGQPEPPIAAEPRSAAPTSVPARRAWWLIALVGALILGAGLWALGQGSPAPSVQAVRDEDKVTFTWTPLGEADRYAVRINATTVERRQPSLELRFPQRVCVVVQALGAGGEHLGPPSQEVCA